MKCLLTVATTQKLLCIISVSMGKEACYCLYYLLFVTVLHDVLAYHILAQQWLSGSRDGAATAPRVSAVPRLGRQAVVISFWCAFISFSCFTVGRPFCTQAETNFWCSWHQKAGFWSKFSWDDTRNLHWGRDYPILHPHLRPCAGYNYPSARTQTIVPP